MKIQKDSSTTTYKGVPETFTPQKDSVSPIENEEKKQGRIKSVRRVKKA